MPVKPRVISADDHVQEPPDLWTKRLSKRWGDRVPQVARQADGVERWVIDGRLLEASSLTRTGALSNERHQEPQTWDQVPQAAFDPDARLKAMDEDGVEVQVLYPGTSGVSGEVLGRIEDPTLEIECVGAYNDWLLETWADASPRFVPQCILPISSVSAAVSETKRAVGMGHRGVIMPPAPWHVRPDAPHIHDDRWDPLWATIQDLDVPVCWHSGGDLNVLLEIYPGFGPAMTKAFDSIRRPISSAQVLVNFLLSGIGERFPGLKVVFTATGIDWVPSQLELCDHQAENAMLEKEGMTIQPSEIFHRQCYVTTWFDRAGMRIRSDVGLGNILWQSEFPLETSTWPRSAELIEGNFAGVPQNERDLILFGNAAKLYRVE